MEKIDFLWSVVEVARYLGLLDLEITRESNEILKGRWLCLFSLFLTYFCFCQEGGWLGNPEGWTQENFNLWTLLLKMETRVIMTLQGLAWELERNLLVETCFMTWIFNVLSFDLWVWFFIAPYFSKVLWKSGFGKVVKHTKIQTAGSWNFPKVFPWVQGAAGKKKYVSKTSQPGERGACQVAQR